SVIGAGFSRVCSTGNQVGVLVATGAVGTFIATNAIGCNVDSGVQISNSADVNVTANQIGTLTGSAAAANGLAGVALYNSDAAALTGNLISGNNAQGVLLDGAGSAFDELISNLIGVDAAGSAALPNGFDGVAVMDGAHDNTIGVGLPGEGNVIS